jgi:hypothetical protein
MIAEAAAVLAGIKTAVDIAKEVTSMSSSPTTAELKMKLIGVIDGLLDAKQAILDISENVEKKDAQIRDLTAKLELKANVIYEKPYYYSYKEDRRDGPFCQKCWDVNQLLVRLIESHNTKGEWQCRNCKTWYNDASYNPLPDEPPTRGWDGSAF